MGRYRSSVARPGRRETGRCRVKCDADTECPDSSLLRGTFHEGPRSARDRSAAPFICISAALRGSDLRTRNFATVGLSVTCRNASSPSSRRDRRQGVSGKGAIFPQTQTKLLSGSTAMICWETIGERLPAVTTTNKVESTPTSAR